MDEFKNMNAEERLQKLMELRGKLSNGEQLTKEEHRLYVKLEDFVEDALGRDAKQEETKDPKKQEREQPSEDDIAKRVVELMQAREPKDPKETEEPKNRDLNPDGSDIEVGEELIPRWVKRTAKVINAHVAKAKDEHGKANRLFSEVQREISEMGSRQIKQENLHIKEKAKEAQERAGSLVHVSAGYEKQLHRFASIPAMVRTLNIGTATAGGTLLPKPFLAELAVIMEERGVARSIFRGIPMSSDTLDLDNVATKPVAAWTNENALISESDMVLAEGTMNANKLAAITSWSMELEEDAAYAWIPVMADLFAESILEKEDDAGFVGDGSASFGSQTGILNLGSAVSYTMPNGETAVSDFTLDHAKAMRDALSLGARRGAVYMLHPDVESGLEGQKSSDGEYIYRRPQDQSRVGTLWGYPVVLTESLPSSGAASTKFAAFGNPVYMLFGTRRGLTAQTSNEGIISDGSQNVTYNAFQQDGMLWKITERVALKAQIEAAFVVAQTAAT